MRTCLAAVMVTGFLFGADPTVEGPRLGYVPSREGVRSVIGMLGASYLGEPMASNWQRSVVLPGSNVAVAVTTEGTLVKVDLLKGESIDLNLSGVIALSASPSGAAVLVVTSDRAYWISRSGTRLADTALPASPVKIAVSDVGTTAAIVAQEPEGEALWMLDADRAQRLIAADAIPALSFVADSSDLLVAAKGGNVSRVSGDLQVAQVTFVADVSALAGTQKTAIVIAKGGIYAVNLSNSEMVRIECACSASSATPIGRHTYLLTSGAAGPMWILDATSESLRTAFIPEAAQ